MSKLRPYFSPFVDQSSSDSVSRRGWYHSLQRRFPIVDNLFRSRDIRDKSALEPTQSINQSIISLISPNDIMHWMLQIKKCTCNSYNIMFERVNTNCNTQYNSIKTKINGEPLKHYCSQQRRSKQPQCKNLFFILQNRMWKFDVEAPLTTEKSFSEKVNFQCV